MSSDLQLLSLQGEDLNCQVNNISRDPISIRVSFVARFTRPIGREEYNMLEICLQGAPLSTGDSPSELMLQTSDGHVAFVDVPDAEVDGLYKRVQEAVRSLPALLLKSKEQEVARSEADRAREVAAQEQRVARAQRLSGE